MRRMLAFQFGNKNDGKPSLGRGAHSILSKGFTLINGMELHCIRSMLPISQWTRGCHVSPNWRDPTATTFGFACHRQPHFMALTINLVFGTHISYWACFMFAFVRDSWLASQKTCQHHRIIIALRAGSHHGRWPCPMVRLQGPIS